MKNERTPFNSLENTGKSGSYSKIYELGKDPNLIVKEVRSALSDEASLDDVLKTKQDYDNLKKDISGYIPNADFLLGEGNDGKAKIFIVQDKVIGEALSRELLSNNKELKKQLEEFVIHVIKRFISSYDKAGNSGELIDLNPENFIWGRISSNGAAEDQLYYVDTSSQLSNIDLDLVKELIKSFCDKFGLESGNINLFLKSFSRN